MDDIAGCRLIFDNIGDLYRFREKFHKAHFNHIRKNDVDKYDYIKNPNSKSGYRGIHDVYEYDVQSSYSEKYKGLLIELQYRTKYQHAWATCVEVIGFITENQPKFQKGDDRFIRILALSSEIIARSFENSKSCFPDISDEDVIKKFVELDTEINFIKILRGLNATDSEISKKKNVILIFSPDGTLEARAFRDSSDALKALFKLEQESSGKDVVLVRADSGEEIRVAFRNYFSDATEFIEMIAKGCQKLAKRDIITPSMVKSMSKNKGKKVSAKNKS